MNRTRDLSACGAVPQPSAPPRAQRFFYLQEGNPHINQLVHFSTVSISDSKRSNRGSINQQNKSPPKRLRFLAVLLFQSRRALHLSFISPSSHLPFLTSPLPHISPSSHLPFLTSPLPHISPSSSIQQCTICCSYTESKRAQTT